MAIIVDREGLEALRAARGVPPVPADVHDLLREAERAKRDGNFDEAERLLQDAVLADPARPSVWTMIGTLEDQLGEVSAAREAYRVALSLADDEHTAMALTRLHLSVGEWDDAIAVATHIAMTANDEAVRASATRLAQEAQSRKGAS